MTGEAIGIEAGGHAGFAVDIADGVLTITFNRPEAGNALQSAAIPQLGAIFREIGTRDDVRVLLICGDAVMRARNMPSRLWITRP